jgi:HK97 family phage prohead protease
MPYFISNEQADCAGWATIKIDDDGSIETIGCHETMNEAVAQMVAVSLDEGIEPGGEYESNSATRQEDMHTMRRGELNNVREVRQYGISDIEVREEGDAGTVTFSGYASVFNHDYEVHDRFGAFTERLAPGAFTRTLSENPDVVLNLNHGMGGTGLPMARTKSGTLRLTQDSVGLRVTADLDVNDPDVQAILPKMRRGDLDEMSFAFRVNDQLWSDDYSDRTITEVHLARGDVSIVSFGANPATVAALRAALADEDVRAELLGEERVLTTADVDPEPETDEPEADDVEADETEERGLPEIVPAITYHLNQLVDRRQSA